MSDNTDPTAWPLWSADEAPPPGLVEWTPSPKPPGPEAPSTQWRPEPRPAPIPDSATVKIRPARRPTCLECGGRTDPDGYCEQCGAKVPTPREHFEAAPAAWVGGVCDRGRGHDRNEDAMALWVSADPERTAILVVCDGVSTSTDSDVAALAAAERARDVLVATQPQGIGVQASHDAAMDDALAKAAAEANAAVLEHTRDDQASPPSCTFAAAVVHDRVIHFANIGDSRVYWIGETDRVQLSVDHSGAEELIAAGLTRVEAENSDQAHAITRWLGRDAPDLVPSTGVYQPREGGWLVVCSDGLWNYASEATSLAEQVQAATGPDQVPVQVAGRLVAWANAQGGRDNITVALARLATTVQEASTDAAER